MGSASPPRKKSRKQMVAAASSDENAPPACFLDSFPKKILNTLLRYFSSIPNAKDWVSRVPLESIIELYSVKGELGTFMKTWDTAKTLFITESFNEIGEHNWKQRKRAVLWTKDIEVARRFVLAGGGQHLHTIVVGAGLFDEARGIEIADNFFTSCPNVTSLSIEDEKGVWLPKFGKQLELLEIVTETSSCISRYCTNLSELNLSMTCYELDWGDLLKAFGGTLECLTLDFRDTEADEAINGVCVGFGEIRTHCRNLRRISIYTFFGTEDLNKGISELLAAYTDQLEFCYVKDMKESELLTITRACKNARFSAQVSRSSRVYPTVKVLGHQLETIAIWCFVDDSDVLDFDGLTNAFNDCFNLRELQLANCSIEHAKAIIATPKEHVKALHINPDEAEEKDVKEIMDILSEVIAGVEELKYDGLEISADAMEKFITRKKS